MSYNNNHRWYAYAVIASIFTITGCLAKLPGYDHGVPGRAGNRYTDLRSADTVKAILYDQLDNWRGVRYRPGGLSKSGVDCSGLVYLTFQSKFGIKLPRTARRQVKFGKKISSRRLQPGDLVFFRTGWMGRHVGIYVDDRRFLHVSTKKGVQLSSLDDQYWRKRYWKSVRISQ